MGLAIREELAFRGAIDVGSLHETFRAALEETMARRRREEGEGEGEDEELSLDELCLCAADIAEKEIEWVWRGRVPRGQVTAIFGPRGAGKSLVAMDIAARVTRGSAWPDDPETAQAPGSVLLITAEDQAPTMVVPRLRAADADMARVRVVSYPHMRLRSTRQLREKEIDRWEKIADKLPDLRLIVVDPFAMLMGTAIDRRTSELTDILSRLSQLAEERNLAVLLVNGTDKVSVGKFWNFGMDVLPYIRATARTVWQLDVDPNDPNRRMFLPAQLTLNADPGGLRLTIDRAAGRVAWDPEPVAIGANRPPASRQALSHAARAAAWLEGFMAQGPRTSAEVLKEGAIAGHSRYALYAAKELLGIVSQKSKEGFDGGWSWEMPAREQTGRDECEGSKIRGRKVHAQAQERKGALARSSPQDSKIRDGESDARSDALPLSAEMQRLLDAVFETDEKPLFPESAAVKPPEKPAHVLAIEARMREAGMEHPVLWDGSDRPKIPG